MDDRFDREFYRLHMAVRAAGRTVRHRTVRPDDRAVRVAVERPARPDRAPGRGSSRRHRVRRGAASGMPRGRGR